VQSPYKRALDILRVGPGSQSKAARGYARATRRVYRRPRVLMDRRGCAMDWRRAVRRDGRGGTIKEERVRPEMAKVREEENTIEGRKGLSEGKDRAGGTSTRRARRREVGSRS
jgi:hypothetical protein